MKNGLKILALLLLSVMYSDCVDKSLTNIETKVPYYPPELTNTTWQMISDPDSAGWSSEKLMNAYYYSTDHLQTAAVMVIYDGKVLYHWGEIDRKYNIHSIRKSFLSALYGIHVNSGNISLDSTMGGLGIDDLPPSLSDLEKTATVRMLLKARSGIYHEAAYESQGMKDARPERYSHDPGTFWYYNNWDFNALGTIFEHETGTKIFEEFNAKIAIPTGMEDYEIADGSYVYESISMHPAYPFRMTARDMARLGLLYLRNGVWNSNRIITQEWIHESAATYSDAGNSGGYGYMWWTVVDGKHFYGVTLPDGSYSARGSGGHYIVVIPEVDLVVVHRVNTDVNHSVSGANFGQLLNLILKAKIN